jgi:dTDP-4-dehydrorhamnose reductase
MAKNKILILGASSYVGRALCNRLDRHDRIATYRSTPIENAIFFDALTMDITTILTSHPGITHAVILLGDTNPETCAAAPRQSHALNVTSIKDIIDTVTAYGIRVIFTSTEFVFDGNKGGYREDDQASPILLYGLQKVAIEKHLIDQGKEYSILRLAKIYGSTPGDGTLFTKWLDEIQNSSQSIKCAADQTFSPVHIDEVVSGIMKVIEHDSQGIFHLSGPQPYKRIDLLKMLLKIYVHYNSQRIEIIPCSIHDFKLQEKRPKDVSMMPDKLVAATGWEVRTPETHCEIIVRNHFKQ